MIVPFQLRFALSRRHRLPELLPWLPALAGSTGFCIGVAILAVVVTPWFLLLLLVPIIAYRGVAAVLCDLIGRSQVPVVVKVDENTLEIVIRGSRRHRPLNDIIQVFRSADSAEWTILQADHSSITIPANLISVEQLEFLKSFALRAAAERKTAHRV